MQTEKEELLKGVEGEEEFDSDKEIEEVLAEESPHAKTIDGVEEVTISLNALKGNQYTDTFKLRGKLKK